MKRRVYLDNAATSFPKPPGVAEAAVEYLNDVGCNLNRGGTTDTCVLHTVAKDTRRLLCDLFNGPSPDNVIFTQNVTASLNYVLKGLLKPGDHVLASAMEHNAVTRPLHQLEKRGVTWNTIPCDEQGRMDVSAIEGLIRENTRILVCTHASNVCGTVMPIREIGEICRRHGVLFVLDTAQTAGVLPIDMVADNVDILCFTGHKGLMAPPGIGGFVIPDHLAQEIEPIIAGGTGIESDSDDMPTKLPMRFEAGTAPLMSMYGMRVALQFLEKEGVERIHAREMDLWEYFLAGLARFCELRVFGTRDRSLSVAVVACDMPGYAVGDLAYLLDHDFGIATRCGVHCAPYAIKTMGVFPEGVLRFSFGYFNTEEELDYTLDAIGQCVKRMKSKR